MGAFVTKPSPHLEYLERFPTFLTDCCCDFHFVWSDWIGGGLYFSFMLSCVCGQANKPYIYSYFKMQMQMNTLKPNVAILFPCLVVIGLVEGFKISFIRTKFSLFGHLNIYIFLFRHAKSENNHKTDKKPQYSHHLPKRLFRQPHLHNFSYLKFAISTHKFLV